MILLLIFINCFVITLNPITNLIYMYKGGPIVLSLNKLRCTTRKEKLPPTCAEHLTIAWNSLFSHFVYNVLFSTYDILTKTLKYLFEDCIPFSFYELSKTLSSSWVHLQKSCYWKMMFELVAILRRKSIQFNTVNVLASYYDFLSAYQSEILMNFINLLKIAKSH